MTNPAAIQPLKELRYQGFTKPCVCHYAIANVGGKPAVVFVQGPLTNTSITNMVEVLSSLILAKDLAGQHPEGVRFFEYYPPALNPIRRWQEVTFTEIHALKKPAQGLLAKVISLVAGDADPESWAVDGPQWQALDDNQVPSAITALVK
jgi:hypothetical protein